VITESNNLKILSWNVNGLRAVMKKGFEDFLAAENPDIICLQETKMSDDYNDLFPGYVHIINNAEKKGYSGVAVLSKIEPLSVSYGLGIPEHDSEGRVITVEYDDYFLVTFYTVNAKRDLSRLQYRQQWDKLCFDYLKKLEEKKPVIFCGDLNVAHKEIDLARPKSNKRNAGFTEEERAGFDRYVEGGFIDTFREFNQEGDNYTWWSYMGGARAKNVGWRIDYFCISPDLREKLKDAFILSEVMGSDHCPVGIIIEK
jgi:exodeoxyribonuclease-3